MQRGNVGPALFREAVVEQRAEPPGPFTGELLQVERVGVRLGVAQDRPQILVPGQDVEAGLRHPGHRLVFAQPPVVGKRVLLYGRIQQGLAVDIGHSGPLAWTNPRYLVAFLPSYCSACQETRVRAIGSWSPGGPQEVR